MAIARTSEVLARTLTEIDSSGERPSPDDWLGIQDDLLASCLGLIRRGEETVPEILHGNRPAAEWLLDDLLIRYYVSRVPELVRRALRFNTVVAQGEVGELAASYLKEASEAFIAGLNSACVALCRAALEAGLKERLPRVFLHDWQLADLLNAAERTKALPLEELGWAHEIRKTANKGLHAARASGDEAFDTLVRTRRVLERLYSKI